MSELSGQPVLMPVPYIAAAATVVATGPSDLVQVLVIQGAVIVIDTNRGLLEFADGFKQGSGVSEVTIAVGVLPAR